MRDAELRVIAIRVAIIGTFGCGVLILAAVTRHALRRDVVRAAKNFHLGKLQHLFLPGQFHTNKSGLRSRFRIWRHDLGLEAGENKVAKTGLRSRFEPQCAQFIARKRQFDSVSRCVLILRDDNPTIVFDLRIAFADFDRLRTLPA